MYPNGTWQLPPLPQANFVPGQDNTQRVLNAVRTGYIVFEITATVTIVGTYTTLLNDGSIAALFSRVVFYENGNPIVQRDAVAMSRMTELLGFSPSSNVRLVALTAGAQALREHIMIPFAWPLAINPWDTPFVAIDQNAPNYVGLTASGSAWTAPGVATAQGSLVVTGGTSAAVTLLNVNMVQEFDTDLGLLPIYRPFMQDLVSNPIATGSDQIFYTDYPDILRSLMITQRVQGVTTVSDIITAYQFRSDTGYVDGNGNDLVFADQVQQQVRKFGGAISASRIANKANPWVDPAHLFRNFQSSGRLSNTLVRAQLGNNPRLLITGQASATTGTSVVVAGMDRLQKVAGVTNPANVSSAGRPIPV